MFVIPGWADAAVAARPPSPAIGYQMGSGGAVGDRTPDLCNAIAALSQLSYGPIVAGLELPARRRPYRGDACLASGLADCRIKKFSTGIPGAPAKA